MSRLSVPVARPLAAVLLIAGSMLLAACGGSDAKSAGETAAPAATPGSGTTETGCQHVAKPAPKAEGTLPAPKTRLAPGKTYVATVRTTCGEFQITLDAKRAPKTGGSFVSLAKQGFFDATTFHRVVAGFVIQGGDPTGSGKGGPGYSVVEAPPRGLQYTRGVVAMAKTQLEKPGTSGSQFFVVTAEDAKLPPEYALLGKVTGGQATVDKIAAAQTDQATEMPIDPIVINSVTVAGQ
jgi:cyclophilin family peptidyl-prolyl cis-trans isomerase